MTKVKALLLVLVIVAASAGFADVKVFILSGSVSSNQRSNTEALCSLRSDLQNRVTSGHNFLRTHPHGIPGISARTLRVSVANAQRTLTALHPLVCP